MNGNKFKAAKKTQLVVSISSIIVILTLVISWAVWKTQYQKNINDILDFFNNHFYNSPFNVNFTFANLTIFNFVFAAAFLVLTVLLTLFRKKRISKILILLLLLIVSIFFFSSLILFIAITIPGYKEFSQELGSHNFALWFAPLIVTIIFSFTTLISSFTNISLIFKK